MEAFAAAPQPGSPRGLGETRADSTATLDGDYEPTPLSPLAEEPALSLKGAQIEAVVPAGPAKGSQEAGDALEEVEVTEAVRPIRTAPSVQARLAEEVAGVAEENRRLRGLLEETAQRMEKQQTVTREAVRSLQAKLARAEEKARHARRSVPHNTDPSPAPDQSRMAALESDLASRTAERAALKQRVAELASRLELAERANGVLKREAAIARDGSEAVERDLEAERERGAALETKLGELEARRTEVEERVRAAEAMATEREGEARDARSDAEAARAELARTRTALDVAKSALRKSQSDLAAAGAESARLAAALEASEARRREAEAGAERDIREAHEELAKGQDDLMAAAAEFDRLVSSSSARMEASERALLLREEMVRERQDLLEEGERRLAGREAAIVDGTAEAMTMLAGAQAKLDSFEEEIGRLRAEANELRALLAERDSETGVLRGQLDALRGDAASLQDRLRTAQELADQVPGLRETMQRNEADAAGLREERDAVLARVALLEQEIARTESILASANNDGADGLAAVEAEAGRWKAEAARSEAAIAAAEKKAADERRRGKLAAEALETELEIVRGQYAEQIAALEVEVDELKAELVDKEAGAAKLAADLDARLAAALGHLRDPHKAMARAGGHWVPDQPGDRCGTCRSSFNAFHRRHHCRKCGGLFCHDHASRSAKLALFSLAPDATVGKEGRVCDGCWAELN